MLAVNEAGSSGRLGLLYANFVGFNACQLKMTRIGMSLNAVDLGLCISSSFVTVVVVVIAGDG